MALKPSITVNSIPDPVTYLNISESTGEYSVSNTGGYGAPNPEAADVSGVIIQMTSFTDLTKHIPYRLLNTERTALGNLGGLNLPVTVFPELCQDGKLKDAVYSMLINVLFNHGNPLTIIAGNQFSLSSAEDVFLDAVGFVIPSLDDKKIYYIDKSKTLNADGGYVVGSLPTSETPLSIEVVYEGSTKLAIYKQGNECLVKDIAIWSDNGCEGVDFRDVLKRYLLKVSIQYKFDNKLYQEAHNMIINLQSYCTNCC